MIRTLTATFSLLAIFTIITTAPAQSSMPYQQPGMFGQQSSGNLLAPKTVSGMFGPQSYGGASFGASNVGMFGNRYFGPAVNSHVTGSGAVRTAATTPSTTPTLSNNGIPTPSNGNLNQKNAPESPAAPENRGQPLPTDTSNGMEGSTPSNPTPASVGEGSATVPRQWAFATAPATGSNNRRSTVRSTVLSDRLTSIARDKGMLVGRRIDVLVQGDTAILQGRVHGQGDRATLANVLSLEPRVNSIDNRLQTE